VTSQKRISSPLSKKLSTPLPSLVNILIKAKSAAHELAKLVIICTYIYCKCVKNILATRKYGIYLEILKIKNILCVISFIL
jgi:hypothetical protein